MKILYIVVALIIIVGGAWYVFARGTDSGMEENVALSVLSHSTTGGDRVHTESSDFYTIEAEYPDTTPLHETAGPSADAAAVLTMEQYIADTIAQFKVEGDFANLTEEDKRILGFVEGRKYALAFEYTMYESPTTVSYVFLQYQDTGGAHPNGFYRTFTFAKADGKPLTLGNLFVSGAPYLPRLSDEAYTQVKTELATRAGAEVTGDMEDTVRIGTSPSPETLQFYYIDGVDLVIIIPPYQAAAYAAGDFRVTVPLAKLSDILNPTYFN